MENVLKIALSVVAADAVAAAISYLAFRPGRRLPDPDPPIIEPGASAERQRNVGAGGEAPTAPGLDATELSPGPEPQIASTSHPSSGSSCAPARSPASSKTGDYDVFISHCGVDTKRNFAVWLKEELENVGVRCFFDDHSLEVGDPAADKMLEAMETATYGVVIFSQGFFEREWCMKELQTFVRRKRVVAIFLPDFAAVESAKKAAIEEKAWTRFKKYVRSEKEFMDAVNANFTGIRLSADDGWWNICIRKTRDAVLRLLGKDKGGLRISEDELLVGQHEHLIALKTLLGLGAASAPGEVRIVGVKGMGGVGKSTLAKQLYDDRDVREWFTGGVCWLEVGQDPSKKDICDLQQQVLGKLCNDNQNPGNPTWGRKLIRERLRAKRVLICLDDVWDDSNIENLVVRGEDLAEGSRVLKTSRLRKAIEGSVYDLDVLDDACSWELFCWHAFRGLCPSELAALTEQALKKCGGLPLAIKLLGGQVKTSLDRQMRLQDMCRLPAADDVMEQCRRVIRSSYDNLLLSFEHGEAYGEAFVLLAGLWPRTGDFIDLSTAKENLAAAVFGDKVFTVSLVYAGKALEALRGCSLIGTEKKDDRLVIVVHDLVVDVAESLVEKGERDLRKFIRQIGTSPAISAVERPWRHLRIDAGSFPIGCLASSSRVQSLIQGPSSDNGSVELDGLDDVPGRCRLLIIDEGPSPPFVLLEELRCLRLRGCSFDSLPDGVDALRNLAILDIHNCQSLRALPYTFGRLTGLTTLDMADSWALAELPESLGQLTGLTALDLGRCWALPALPRSLGQLKGLADLDLTGCKTLAVLPESIGRLKGLHVLKLRGCKALTALPESLGQLTGLTTLDLYECKALAALPKSLGQLTGLTGLELTRCKALTTLPESLGLLTGLMNLKLSWCEVLAALPESLGQLTGLTALELTSCKALTTLPESLGLLTGLRDLKLSWCEVLAALPESLGKLTGLTVLNLIKCKALTTLPESLGLLTGLTDLKLSCCKVLAALPESLRQLTGLTALQLIDCKALTTLPESLGLLTGLTDLELSWCEVLAALPESVGKLTGLPALELTKCKALTTLPESLGLLTGLTDLKLSWCDALTALPESLGQLKGLTALELIRCEALAALPESLGQLKGLTALDLCGCVGLSVLPESLGQLIGLKRLSLADCILLEALPNSFGKLTRLTALDLSGCITLVVQDQLLSQLMGLTDLDLRGGPSAVVYRHHLHVVCDGCSDSPIEGPRFMRMDADFDLCSHCMSARLDERLAFQEIIDPWWSRALDSVPRGEGTNQAQQILDRLREVNNAVWYQEECEKKRLAELEFGPGTSKSD